MSDVLATGGGSTDVDASPDRIQRPSVRELRCEHFGDGCAFLVSDGGLAGVTQQWDAVFESGRCPDCGGRVAGIARE